MKNQLSYVKLLIVSTFSLISLPMFANNAHAWDPSQNSNDWMRNLSDKRVQINELLLPGTHDSGTYDFSIGDNILRAGGLKTQNKTITEQLEGGIRFFDLRLGFKSSSDSGADSLLINHAGDFWLGSYTNVSFPMVKEQFANFLQENPSEVIIALIRIEGNRADSHEVNQALEEVYNATQLNYPPQNSDQWGIAKNHQGNPINSLDCSESELSSVSNNKSMWFFSNDIPKYCEVRGKVVVLAGSEVDKGFDVRKWPDNVDVINENKYNIQDKYSVSLERKKDAVMSFGSSYMKNGHEHQYNLNFLSFASVNNSLLTIGASAADINSQVDFLMSPIWGPYAWNNGIVIMDYPFDTHDSQALVQKIINKNLDYLGPQGLVHRNFTTSTPIPTGSKEEKLFYFANTCDRFRYGFKGRDNLFHSFEIEYENENKVICKWSWSGDEGNLREESDKVNNLLRTKEIMESYCEKAQMQFSSEFRTKKRSNWFFWGGEYVTGLNIGCSIR